ncbi:MAG: alpha/beta fold hydrolase [Vicinamibacterales bacterium]
MYHLERMCVRRGVFAAILAVLLGACAQSKKPAALDHLHACNGEDGPTDAYCGTYPVFENRDTRQGRTIDLRLVVLPALSNEPKPDPVFFLAGGPGQGAAELARPIKDLFRTLQTDRDIVLVDQRGTGKSRPLNCVVEDDTLQSLNEPESATVGLDRLKKCLAGYDADPTLYTTTIAMDDLDDVRGFLGYDAINIYGGSYGTRAGLVYLRQHGDRVRAIVLDGVAPTNMRLPLFFARDAQRALDHLLADCTVDAGCNAKYPGLNDRLRALFARLEKAPPHVRLTHPRTGVAEEVNVEATFLASIIHAALYSPLIASLLPELVTRAEHNDFQGLLALVMLNDGAAENMSIGMQMSVLCAEDFRQIDPADVDKETAGTVFAKHLVTQHMQVCEFWPKGKVAASYYEPVTSDRPALVLSGEVDPVTPPAWGAAAAAHLSKSTHVVVSNTGHGVISTGCGLRMVREFIKAGSVDGLDTRCASTVKRPPFFLTPAGPDPAATSAKATP